MALRISNSSGTFDLSKEFNVEIEDSSPIYNERGSQSIAATIPGTKRNLQLNRHINRMDTDSAPIADERVVIADGVYHRTGKMNTVKASKTEGITFNVGFGESELYSILNDVPMQSLTLPIYKPAGGLADIFAYINDIYLRKKTDEPFAVFPISVSCNLKDNNITEEYHEYINGCKDYAALVWGARTEKFIINGDIVDVSLPEGYGVSPFLKVSYILEAIFSNYGYTVVENPFSSHHQLKYLVVLNNAADCCVKGQINYADLMPDCTINEFLQALWCRFGLLYFVDGNTRTVRLKFIRDIVKTPHSSDWTSLKASEPIINFEVPQQLKLSAATNIKGPTLRHSAAPAAESLDKFLKPYNYIVSSKGVGNGYLSYHAENGLYYRTDNISGRTEVISTFFFQWDRGADLAYKEITSIDESLPSVLKEAWPVFYHLPLYLVGKVHRYTTIASSDVELSENSEYHTPLCFCFAYPVDHFTEGRSICVDLQGKPIVDKSGNKFDISLYFAGQYGLFNNFWKEYDAILRHANHSIEADIHLSAQQSMNTDFSSPILMDGQRMLPDTIRYTLPKNSTSPSKVKFRTIKLLKPFDLDKEQNVPIVDQLYKWQVFDNKNEAVNNAIESQKSAWESQAIKDGGRLYDLQYKNVTSDAGDVKFPLTVPTEEDYNNKREIFIRKINYGFDLYYRVQTFLGATPDGHLHYDISQPKGGVHFDVQYDQSVRAVLF